MSILFNDDDSTEPTRLTGLGVLLVVLGGVLVGVGDGIAGLGWILLAVGGCLLYVGLTSWAITIGLAAHAASVAGKVNDS